MMQSSPEAFRPRVIKNCFPPKVLKVLQSFSRILKNSSTYNVERDLYFRNWISDSKYYTDFHQEYVFNYVQELFDFEIIPSYCFWSSYVTGMGKCPMHIDLRECFITLDLCLNQDKAWPIYINDSGNFSLDKSDNRFEKRSSKEIDQIKSSAKRFDLEIGDALLFSGTNHIHWRNQLEGDNFCDLVFFHYIKKS